MITYKYRAQDENGKAISGTMQATDELDLHERLKQEKKYLIQAKAQADKVNIKRLRSDVVSEFAKNIGELLGAGVTLVKALRIISEDESHQAKGTGGLYRTVKNRCVPVCHFLRQCLRVATHFHRSLST